MTTPDDTPPDPITLEYATWAYQPESWDVVVKQTSMGLLDAVSAIVLAFLACGIVGSFTTVWLSKEQVTILFAAVYLLCLTGMLVSCLRKAMKAKARSLRGYWIGFALAEMAPTALSILFLYDAWRHGWLL